MAHDDASLKRTFERLLWQRSEVLKLIERADPKLWTKNYSGPENGMFMCHGSLYDNTFELVKSEWEDLERIDGREPLIVNDEQFGGDPGADLPDHAIAITWLRSRNGCLSLWRQNEARKAAMFMDFDNLDLDREIVWEMPAFYFPGMGEVDGLDLEGVGEFNPNPDAPKMKEVRASVRQLIWNWYQPLTISIGGVRHALEMQGFKADIARIYPPETMRPA
ncbi:MAG: hypothetical protein M5U25_01185 [Planctomycetota bacterium]|nr:hypothetical protein [Planctomycetota bacterium]